MFIIFFAYLSSKLFYSISFSFFWNNPLENSFPVGGVGGKLFQFFIYLKI